MVSVVENPGNGYDDSVDYDALAGQTITVAASPTPHAEILEIAKEILAALMQTTSSMSPIWMTSTPRTARTLSPYLLSMWSRWDSMAASRLRWTLSAENNQEVRETKRS